MRRRHRVHVVGFAVRRLLAVELACHTRTPRRAPCRAAAWSPARSRGRGPCTDGWRNDAASPAAASRPESGPGSPAAPRPDHRPCSTWTTAAETTATTWPALPGLPALLVWRSTAPDRTASCRRTQRRARTRASRTRCRNGRERGMLRPESTSIAARRTARERRPMATYLFAWNPSLWSWPELARRHPQAATPRTRRHAVERRPRAQHRSRQPRVSRARRRDAQGYLRRGLYVDRARTRPALAARKGGHRRGHRNTSTCASNDCFRCRP